MTNDTGAFMKQVSWQEIEKKAHEVNPEFANIIDEIVPSDKLRLYLIRYPYGSECLVNGKLHVPNARGQLKPLSDPSIPSQIHDDLSYNLGSNPVGLILNNSFELFLSLSNRTIPSGVIPVGKVTGTWRLLNNDPSNHPCFIWNMTAGARTLFMLPKISESVSHQKLIKFLGVTHGQPKNLLDHWHIFRQIYQMSAETSPWYCQVLYFSREWFKDFDNPKWRKLKKYFTEKAWAGSEFYRNQYIWNLAFSLIQENNKVKPGAYITDTVKHLLNITAGGKPGFAPATDEKAAPIKLFQEAYLTIYKLKNYTPIIMEPKIFNHEIQQSVYYSLNFPTAIEFAQKSNEKNSAIADLFAVRSLLNTYHEEILRNNLHLENTILYDAMKKTEFKYFHSAAPNYPTINENKKIPYEDSRFTKTLTMNKNTEFPYTSTFINAVVRIMP